MKINRIKLTNFRSYKKAEVKFNDSVLIVGPNAQGKTNLLEAIYLGFVGKTLRARENDLISWGEDFFRIEMDVEGAKKVELIFERLVTGGRKTLKINGVKRSAKALYELGACVFFGPAEIDAFFTIPAVRRRYFNILCSRLDLAYAVTLAKYTRTLDQRNALLKRIQKGLVKEAELELWDGQLAELAAGLIQKRLETVTKLNNQMTEHYQKIADDKKTAELRYESSWDTEYKNVDVQNTKPEQIWGQFTEALLKNRKKDIALGVTTAGPHRDNYALSIDGMATGSFASRGEGRTLLLALKFSELGLLEEVLGKRAILLLDDVFSELDEKRRRYLVQNFGDRQVIVTTTDMDHIDPDLREKAQVFHIKDSKLMNSES